LKPLIVYAPALEKDIVTLATPIDDGRIKIGNWTPKNYGDKYVGISNVRDAIKHSSNTVAVKVATYIGETTMYEYGTKFGMSLCENDKNLTLALGATTKGQNPLQIAKAYTIFSNGGKMKNTTFLRYIVDNGKKIYTHKALENQVITKETAFLIRDCLIDTAQDGTAKTLSALPFSVASKTGTVSSNNTNTDGWNVSFNDKFTIVVWHGDAVNETGGGHPTKHAYHIWSDLSKNMPKELFISGTNTPNTIIKMPVDVYSTQKLMQVAMATNHTPKYYIKYEYFKQSKQSNYVISLFEKCPLKFSINVNNDKNMVEINFDADEIYTYKLIRKDILGKQIVGEYNGKNNIRIYDRPTLYGFPIEYTLIAYPKGQSNVVGVCSKTILI
jgi:membrane peptidoglycan carboxypeptidase